MGFRISERGWNTHLYPSSARAIVVMKDTTCILLKMKSPTHLLTDSIDWDNHFERCLQMDIYHRTNNLRGKNEIEMIQ
jgi:hypothetical protein